MLSYFLEVSIYWLVFYLPYHFLMSKETFLRSNRRALLAGVSLGLLLPLLKFPLGAEASAFAVWLPAVTVGLNSVDHVFEINTGPMFPNGGLILKIIYLSGLTFYLGRIAVGLFRIHRLATKGEKIHRDSIILVKTEEVHSPFSFLNYLFWSKSFDLENAEARQIFKHELAHIRQRHSLDVLFMEIIMAIFWWNPLVYAFKSALRDVHEYLADAAALAATDKQQYGHLLIHQAQFGPGLQYHPSGLPFVNHFFHSQLKKRIQMMTKKKSPKLAAFKYVPVLLLLAITYIACNKTELSQLHPENPAQLKAGEAKDEGGYKYKEESVVTLDEKTGKQKTETLKAYISPEELPRFPGCEHISNAEERNQCAQMKLAEFIGQNMKYPKEASDKGIEGMVVASFLIDETGAVKKVSIVKSLDPSCDAEVTRLINLMPRWIPGKVNGKAVNVEFKLPLKFQLDEKEKTKQD